MRARVIDDEMAQMKQRAGRDCESHRHDVAGAMRFGGAGRRVSPRPSGARATPATLAFTSGVVIAAGPEGFGEAWKIGDDAPGEPGAAAGA